MYVKMTFARDGRDTSEIFLMHLGPFIFATRAEACEYNFGPMQIQHIREGRPVSDFCVFRKTKGWTEFLAREGAPETHLLPTSYRCDSGHFGHSFFFCLFLQKTLFFQRTQDRKKTCW